MLISLNVNPSKHASCAQAGDSASCLPLTPFFPSCPVTLTFLDTWAMKQLSACYLGGTKEKNARGGEDMVFIYQAQKHLYSCPSPMLLLLCNGTKGQCQSGLCLLTSACDMLSLALGLDPCFSRLGLLGNCSAIPPPGPVQGPK